LEDVWPLLLLLLLTIVFFKFALPKWWAWFPFSVKVGKLDNKQKNKTKFSDVAGMEEVKNELSEVVDYLKHPAKYHKVGARHPKWVLLFWEPWSGKTLLARAVAGESDVPFFSVSGSEFMEMLVGMGAAKVRELFERLRLCEVLLFLLMKLMLLEEKRCLTYMRTSGARANINQILTEMDWFDNTTNIIVMAATNRPDILDPALLRAWRFDRKIMVSRPTYEERFQIFTYYLKHKKTALSVSIESLAKRTSGLVWADIENIVNEASLKIAKESRTQIEVQDFEYALEKVLMWPEKKVKSMNDQEKQIVALHELWHAVTAYFLTSNRSCRKDIYCS
jgi:cell division protease FtsH